MIPSNFIDQLNQKKSKIGVVGLGYVGLPIALEFAKQYDVIGFDINSERVELMQNAVDPSNEIESAEFQNKSIQFTDNPESLSECSVIIIAVPTPVNEHNAPNLTPVTSASKSVGNILQKGAIVIYESTVYPGCTEEDCIPILEHQSGLKWKTDFFVGYSPERINPGDKEHTLTRITKVVSGCCPESTEIIDQLYSSIITAGTFKAVSIKVAEAAKVIENTQRDLNIALMNELSKIFNILDINTYDVLEAAGTKWNFLKFSPGLVGGHCIGVDPYYLTYKANELGYQPEVILSGRRINDDMPAFVAKTTIKKLNTSNLSFNKPKVILLGITFKENVSDIRNSKIASLAKELIDFGIELDIYDPHASAKEVHEEYDLKLTEQLGSDYDAIILAVPHKEFITQTYTDLLKYSKHQEPVFIDLKGNFRAYQNINQNYWSL